MHLPCTVSEPEKPQMFRLETHCQRLRSVLLHLKPNHEIALSDLADFLSAKFGLTSTRWLDIICKKFAGPDGYSKDDRFLGFRKKRNNAGYVVIVRGDYVYI